MTVHTKVEAVFNWNDVYIACRQTYPEAFEGFDPGSWTGVSWPGSILFRQDRMDGLEPSVNPTTMQT